MENLSVNLQRQELDEIKHIDQAQFKIVKIKDDTTFQSASDLMGLAKKKIKEITDKRMKFTRPLDKLKKDIIAEVQPQINLLEQIIADQNEEVLAYKEEQDRILKEQQEKEERERKRKEAELQRRLESAKKEETKEKLQEELELTQTEVPVVQETFKPKGLSFREVWKYRIIDEDKIPRTYMVPNEKLLSEMASKMKGKIEVPGVKFYQEKITANR